MRQLYTCLVAYPLGSIVGHIEWANPGSWSLDLVNCIPVVLFSAAHVDLGVSGTAKRMGAIWFADILYT